MVFSETNRSSSEEHGSGAREDGLASLLNCLPLPLNDAFVFVQELADCRGSGLPLIAGCFPDHGGAWD